MVSPKYTVGKRKGKWAILNRVIREHLTWKYKQRPKGYKVYLGEEKCKRRKVEDSEMKKERELLVADPAGLWASAVRLFTFLL